MNVRNRMSGAMLALSLAFGAGAAAAEGSGPVVVELYTSQGCSSCPPADALLRELAMRDDVLPLALHVDYWDYIGWADGFARPEFTRRQHSYAQAAGEHTVYTPQMVVGGIDHIVGTRPMALMDLIRAHADIAGDVTLEVSRDDDVLQVRAVARQGLAQGMVVQMVRYTPEATVDIPRGENAGRTMVYANIVTSWENLGDWPGDAPLALDVPVTGADPAVIVIQRPGPGLILAAAVVR